MIIILKKTIHRIVKFLQNIFAAIIIIIGIYAIWSEPNSMRPLFGILFIIVGLLNIIVINETSSIFSAIAALISNFLILVVLYNVLPWDDWEDTMFYNLILYPPFCFLFISLLYNLFGMIYKKWIVRKMGRNN